jgi:chromosome segregation ATPase
MGRQHRRALRFVVASATLAVGLVPLAGTMVGQAAPSQNRISAARERLADLEARAQALTTRLEAARERVDTLKVEITGAQRGIRRLAQRMVAHAKDVDAFASELYKTGGLEAIEAVMSLDSITEVESTLEYLGSSQRLYIQRFRAVAVDRARLNRRLNELEEARAETRALVEEIRGAAADLDRRVEAQQDQVAELEAARQRAIESASAQAQEVADEAESVAAGPAPPAPTSGADWDAIAMCESGGNWHIDSTYDGGLQFHPDTWLAYGGAEYAQYAWQATREQQIAIAERVLAGQGPGAWPNCFTWA